MDDSRVLTMAPKTLSHVDQGMNILLPHPGKKQADL